MVADSSVVCGNRSVRIPRSVDSGPIRVRNGGRRIIVAADPARIVLDQVEDEPGRYKGTVKDRSTGRAVDLRYDVRVLNPERMKGTLRADFTVEGSRCTLKRDWNSRYIGK